MECPVEHLPSIIMERENTGNQYGLYLYFLSGTGSLTARTTEKHHETGAPVCCLNEQGDTTVSYGKYEYCRTDTMRNIGFVYENRPDAGTVCIDNQGKELFYVSKCDNRPDYIREGLFRIMDADELTWFADTSGNVDIKPQFKFAFPFKGGKAKVTFTGEKKRHSTVNITNE